MDYLKFENWENSHIGIMQDLSLSKPFDIFIFTRFTKLHPSDINGIQFLFAETIEEAIGYLRHIFLYDILNDNIDDLNFDFKTPFDSTQENVISILNHWNKISKIPSCGDSQTALKLFCKKFNEEFSNRNDTEYEIHCLFGANNLRNFLTSKFSDSENFDKNRLSAICNDDLYAGYAVKEFINSLFE